MTTCTVQAFACSLVAAVVLAPRVSRAQVKPESNTTEPAVPEAVTEAQQHPDAQSPRRDHAAMATTTTSDSMGSVASSPRGAALDWLVMPSGYDLGGSLRFAMSPPGALSERSLRFTDLGLFDLYGRLGVGAGFEIVTSTTLAVKQPSDADENLWQGSSLALKWQPGMSGASSPDDSTSGDCRDCKPNGRTGCTGKHFVLGLGGAAGPMLDNLGMWTSGSTSIASRKRLVGDETGGLQFEGSLGGQGTLLLPRRGKTTALAEAQVALGILAHVGKRGRRGGGAAMWLSSTFALPVWHRGDDPVSHMALDPQTRLGFAIGAMATLTNTWDLIFEMRATDRGDLEFPRTRLPILDGGFDARQLVFAVTYHGEFSSRKPRRGPLMLIP